MKLENFITVIVATYNRSKSLKDVLTSLMHQKCELPFDYEVIVVDNASTDNTHEVVMMYKSEFRERLKYVLEIERGKSSAMNRGVKEASGEMVAVIDDDCIASENWVNLIGNYFKIIQRQI